MNLASPTLWMLSWTVLYGAGLLIPIMGRVVWKGRWREQYVDLSVLLALIGSLAAALGAVMALVRPAAWDRTVQVFSLLSAITSLGYLPAVEVQIRVDSLSASFALLIAAFAAVVAIYSFGALRATQFQRQKAWIAGVFNVFVWATLMVVIVNDLFSLIVVLEIMTLAFACLALYKQNHYQDPQEHEPSAEQRKDARLAPQIYLIISHTSSAFLILASLLLAQFAGSFSFDDFRQNASVLPTELSTFVFLGALIGLGIRAGLTPAHFWVSLVHPSSPTTTHAFSLGIAIKVAIYLMIRYFFQFLAPRVEWGYLLLGVAVVTAVVNVWYAIASHDLKKALAYHSVENVGIIVAGVGAALVFHASGMATLAILALTASLFHLLNHAVFKGLLYLCTGAIERLTCQIVDIERLGGLLKIWPLTAGTFLVGAVSIAGFPPFNGFVSEWLTLQALLKGLGSEKLGLAGDLAVVLSIAFLFASFALTAFCFAKITGLALLGQPRADVNTIEEWRHTPDVPWSMHSTMFLLAALCLVLGLFPVGVASLLGRVATDAMSHTVIVSPIQSLASGFESGLLASTFVSPFRLFWVFVVSCLLGLVAWAISKARLLGRSKTVRPATPWNCGTPYTSAQMQYTGAALSFLIRDLFGAGWGTGNRQRPIDYLPAYLLMSEGAAGSQPKAGQVVTEAIRIAYNYFIGWLLLTSAQVENSFQNGDIRRYLLYILVTNLVVLLLFLVLVRLI